MNDKTKNIIIRIGTTVIPSPIGGAFFKITKPFFINNTTSKLGDAWWWGYLFYVACYYDIEKLKNNNNGYVAVRTLLPDFDWFISYNTVFQEACIAHILYEISFGNIPVIDDKWQVWDSLYERPIILSNDKTDKKSLKESDEKNVLFSPQFISGNKKIREVWCKLIKDFCRLNEQADKYISDESSEVLSKGNRILAIVCRGTDYIGTGMPLQPKVEDVINEAREWMQKFNYDKIYLATEAESIFEAFDKAFPGQILVNKRTYYEKAMAEQNIKWIGSVSFDRENDDYLKSIEYLSSIHILSKCKALLAGHCGASNMALLMNGEKYERFKIYQITK